VSPLRTLARVEISVAIEVGTGCARKGAGRMPDQANLAQGNPNSMPQNQVSSKVPVKGSPPWSARSVSPTAATASAATATAPTAAATVAVPVAAVTSIAGVSTGIPVVGSAALAPSEPHRRTDEGNEYANHQIEHHHDA
jgi:hypothetical protein